MDQLELLKQQWNTSSFVYPKYNTDQLSSLVAKRSGSIVRWLFYIAIMEFAFFAVLTVLMYDTENEKHARQISGDYFYFGSYIFHYVVLLGFIYLFYKNYRSISATQPTRSLMKAILKTRRTMKCYIWYNLIYIMVFTIAFSVLMLFNDPLVLEMSQKMKIENLNTFYALFIGIYTIAAAVLCGLFYLIYSLIYGILLRRLRGNYEELKKMEA